MGYVNSEIAKKICSERVFFKKLSIFKEVGFFYIISFKNRFHWYNKMLQFSGLVVLRSTTWAMRTLKMKKNVRICRIEKKISLYEAVAIFSRIYFENRFLGIVD